MNLSRSIVLSCFLSSLAACAVGPDYVRPETPAPPAWQELPQGVSAGEAEISEWWRAFGDPALDRLVERSLRGNRDLRQAVARVAEARALYRIAASAELPQVDAEGDVTRARRSENGAFPGAGDATAYTLGLSAGWEVDVFGRVRRSVESATASVEASEEDRRAVEVALAAEVASAHVNVRTLQSRLKVAYANLDSQTETLELTRVRLEGGVASGLDVAQAESVLASTRTTVPSLERALLQELNRVSVLLGEPPGSVLVDLADGGTIPAPPAALTVGFPADVIRQRPDIRRAERELAAQTARIGIATADLFPRLTLLGSFGFDATHVADLFTGASRAYSVGPAIRWNIFDAGRIRGLIHAEEARTDQALAAYEQSVLRGLEEVENALIAYARFREERQAVDDALRAASRSLSLATDLYKDGLVDFQNVLDAQREVFEFQDQLARTDGLAVQSLVALYRALGGGWQAAATAQKEEHERNA
jgi:outer membrane protein, multidrug efflux system